MDFQVGFDLAIGLVAFLGGWIMKNLSDSLNALQKADNELTNKVQAIEVLVAGTYVKRDELDKLGEAIFKKLDRIEGKLDGKADK